MSIKYDDSLGQIHIALVTENIKGTRGEQLQRQRHILCDLFGLLQQFLAERGKGGRGAIAFSIGVDSCETAVNDRLVVTRQFLVIHAIDQGHDKLGLGRDGIAVAVPINHIKRVQIILATGTEVDDGCIIAAHRLDDRPVFAFGIKYHYLIAGGKIGCDDLVLGCNGFTRAGLADDDSTGIDAVFLVAKDRITGYLVHTKVDAVTFQNVRDLKQMERSQGTAGEGAEGVGHPVTNGQRGVQTIDLLEPHNIHLTVLTNGIGTNIFGFLIQLTFTVSCNYQGNHGLEFTLVIVLEFLQMLQAFFLLHLHVIRCGLRVVAVGVLTLNIAMFVCHKAHVSHFGIMNTFVLRNGQDIHGTQNVLISIKQIIHKVIVNIVGNILQEQNPHKTITDFQMVAMATNSIRADIVTEGRFSFLTLLNVEVEVIAFTGTVEVVQEQDPFLCTHGRTDRSNQTECLFHLTINSLEVIDCIGVVAAIGGNGHVLVIHIAGTLAGLTRNDTVTFLTEPVILISGQRDADSCQSVPFRRTMVEGTDLCDSVIVDAIEDISGIPIQHTLLVFVGGNLIVDVGKAIAFGIEVSGFEDTIFPDRINGDQGLHTPVDFILLLPLLAVPLLCFRHVRSPFCGVSLCGACSFGTESTAVQREPCESSSKQTVLPSCRGNGRSPWRRREQHRAYIPRTAAPS